MPDLSKPVRAVCPGKDRRHGSYRRHTEEPGRFQGILEFSESVVVGSVSIDDNQDGSCAVAFHPGQPDNRHFRNPPAIGGFRRDADVLLMEGKSGEIFASAA